MHQKRAHTLLHMRALLSLCPRAHSAPPRAPTLMFAAPDGTLHPLIDLCSDSSEDEAAAGGPCDAFVEVGDALALAVNTSEDDECEEEPVRAGLWHCIWIYIGELINAPLVALQMQLRAH